jgi:RadC-like JAB domain
MNLIFRAEQEIKYLNGLEQSKTFFEQFLDLSEEQLCVAHLSDDGGCLAATVSRSNMINDGLPVGKILSDVIQYNSSGIIIAHNYSKLNPIERIEIWKAVQSLIRASEIMEFVLVDLVHHCGERWTSARALGVI